MVFGDQQRVGALHDDVVIDLNRATEFQELEREGRAALEQSGISGRRHGLCRILGMATVLGIFKDQARALAVIESLRAARFDVDSVRLIGGPSDVAGFASRAGPSAHVAAGPSEAVLEGLVGSDLPEDQLAAVEQRVQAGAAVLLAAGLDSEAARQFAAQLREHQAEDVISQ